MCFALATLILSVFISVNSEMLEFCCDPEWILYKNVDLNICIKNKENNSVSDLVYTGRVELSLGSEVQLPAILMENEEFRECEPTNYYNNSFLDQNSFNITKNSCLVHTNQINKVRSCEIKNKTLNIALIINKCCPHGYTYTSHNHKCIFKEPDFKKYSNILRSTAIFLDNLFECSTNKVLVEYIVTEKVISFTKEYIIWKDGSKMLHYNDFCVEAFDTTHKQMSQDEGFQKFLVRTCQQLKVCESLPCIRRCCGDGEIYAKGKENTYCKRDGADIGFHSFSNMEISANFVKPDELGILRGLDCPKFRLDPESFSDEFHVISSYNGSLYLTETKKMYTNNQYCLEKIANSSINAKLYTFLCFDSTVVVNDRIRFRMYPIGLLISCVFYAFTLIVYISIAKLRNLPGKILISLISNLFLAYMGIALGQLLPTSNDDICFISGLFVYFCLMAAFSWMNVTCYDIWHNFGSTKSSYLQMKDQFNRFIFYCLYGWGVPTILTTITATLIKSNILSDNIRPYFGRGRCWFTYDAIGFASLLFFSGPVGLLFLINFVFFLLTLRYCNKVKMEISRMQGSNTEKHKMKRRFFIDKARFGMNLKLCIVMGITWLLEITSIIFYDHEKVFFWSVSDSFNVLLGIFVFVIFVFKKRIWNEVRNKLGLHSKMGKNGTGTVTNPTQNTLMTSFKVEQMT